MRKVGLDESLQAKTEQLAAVTDAMAGFLEDGNWRNASRMLLSSALRQTESEYGFIGVLTDVPTLRILAHEGIVWHSDKGRDFYDEAMRTYEQVGYLEFTSFDNLFGKVLTTGKAIISNNPTGDPRSGGLPSGHPPLRQFLGVPITQRGAVVGLIGVANCSGGYTGGEQTKIEILSRATGVLYDSYCRQERELALEETLRVSEERYRDLYDNAPDMFYSVDATDGRIIRCNQTLVKKSGYSREEILQRSVFDMYPPDALQEVQRAFEVFKKTGEFRDLELPLRRRDGEKLWVSVNVSAIRDEDGNVLSSRSVLRDITERKRAEEELQRRAAELHSLIETIPHGIENIDLSGTITLANSALHKMYEHGEGQLLGTSILDHVTEEPEREKLRAYLQYLVKEQPAPTLYLGKKRTKKGRVIDVQVAWDYRRDEQERVTGFTSVITDITEVRERAAQLEASNKELEASEEALRKAHDQLERRVQERTRQLADSNTALRTEITQRKRTEEELQRRRDELAHMSRLVAMGELATTIAHEINQPLTVILSGAGATRRLLAADEPDLEKLDEVQQLIVESATRAGKIIRHQKDFLHRGEVKKAPVAINQLIRNIEQVIRAEVLRNKITLLLDLAPDLPSLMGDPIQLEQVILNLIRNSLETMGDPAWGNRELVVQTSMSGPHRIMLRVRDTGPPINDETFAQMFTPFHSTKPEGLGMGLPISRTIVEAHGGRLGATRNADLGITIDLTLACEERSSR